MQADLFEKVPRGSRDGQHNRSAMEDLGLACSVIFDQCRSLTGYPYRMVLSLCSIPFKLSICFDAV